MKPLLLRFLALLLVIDSAALRANAAGDSDAAYKTLLKAGTFSVGGVGIAGTITDSEIACRTLMKSAAPGPVFSKVLEEGTPAAKMFALCGLYYKSPETFAKVAATYRKSRETFQYAAGCIIMNATIEDEMRNLEAKRFDGLLNDLPKR